MVLGPLSRNKPITPPKNSTATEPSTMLPGSGTAASSVMPKLKLFNVLTSPPDTSVMNSVQFPLEFSPLNELSSAGLRTGALKSASLTAPGSTV